MLLIIGIALSEKSPINLDSPKHSNLTSNLKNINKHNSIQIKHVIKHALSKYQYISYSFRTTFSKSKTKTLLK